MAIEMKLALVKENDEICGGFVLILPDNGVPTMLGSVDEPLEVTTIEKSQLMNGLHALPQELLMTVDQFSSYTGPEMLEEMQRRFRLME